MKKCCFIFLLVFVTGAGKLWGQIQFHSIRFEHNSQTISSSGKRVLDSLAIMLNAQQFQLMKIIGIADTTGSPLYNVVLSKKREEAVERYLKKRISLPNEKLYVTWLGEDTDGVYDLHFSGIHAQERCVDILVYLKKEDR